MSRFAAFLLAVRLFLSHAVVPTSMFVGVVYGATWVGGGADLEFSLVMGVLVLMPFTFLAAEEWSRWLKASMLPPPVVEIAPEPAPEPEPMLISAEVSVDDLAWHRRSVYAAGGQIVQSSPIGSMGDRFIVHVRYPASS